MTEPLPRNVRRELLLARAAVERIDAAQALADLRHARGPFGLAAEAFSASGLGRGGVARNVVSLLALVREHPYLGSVASVAFGALQGSKLGRWIRRLALASAAVAGTVWAAGRISDSGARDTRGSGARERPARR